uniref:Ankyrin repeat domain 26 n=1 Tax=Canis lupus familiaris TaxID=9615 RepID=A0A8I3SA04_CANLF
ESFAMKTVFSFGGNGRAALGLQDQPPGPGYHIPDRGLRKIHKAASGGNAAKVQQILLLGINDLNDRDHTNRSALHLACVHGYVNMVKLLVDQKCQVNLCDEENRTALMKVQYDEVECARFLLEHGADPNIMDNEGNTALHYATLMENLPMAEKLLLHKADIEAKNKVHINFFFFFFYKVFDVLNIYIYSKSFLIYMYMYIYMYIGTYI